MVVVGESHFMVVKVSRGGGSGSDGDSRDYGQTC